jgi:hypothetical protein
MGRTGGGEDLLPTNGTAGPKVKVTGVAAEEELKKQEQHRTQGRRSIAVALKEKRSIAAARTKAKRDLSSSQLLLLV